MKTVRTLLLLLLLPTGCLAQANLTDSLKRVLRTQPPDTSRVNLLLRLSGFYWNSRPDTAMILARQALSLSNQTGFITGQIRSINATGNVFRVTGNYPKALEMHLLALKKAEAAADRQLVARHLSSIGIDYNVQGNYRLYIDYTLKALRAAEAIADQQLILNQTGNLGDGYEKLNRLDSALFYTNRAYALATKAGEQRIVGVALNNLGNIAAKRGQDVAALDYYRRSLPIYSQFEDEDGFCEVYMGMATLFQKRGTTDSSLYYAKRTLTIARKAGFVGWVMQASDFLTRYYTATHQIDSAFVYQSAALSAKDSLFSQEKQREVQRLSFEETLRQQELQDAKDQASTELTFNLLVGGLVSLLLVAFLLYRNNRQKQKANRLLQSQKQEIDHKAAELLVQKESLQQAYTNVEQLGEIGRKITASLSVEHIISTVYANVNTLMDAAVFGIGLYNPARRSLDFPATYERGQVLPPYANGLDDANRLAVLCFTDRREISLGHLDKEHGAFTPAIPTPHQGQQAVSLIYLPLLVKDRRLGVITVQSFEQNAYSDYHLFMLRAIAIYTAIALENAESFETLNQTVQRLKATQTQLVQKEKMASLGELTAGIAHEIQNPLNFVNNFSEVSAELVGELEEEQQKPGRDTQLEAELLGDLKQNLRKITHHGGRASAIVRGMLEHARTGTGEREATNLNALADEYLRLSYHGLRAKDKDFNADLVTDFAPDLPKVEVMPQELGRVLLNLYNNAFYAVHEKQPTTPAGYKPVVRVSTRRTEAGVEIRVRDNGTGMSDAVKAKIFQPFFTTKPTGEGTGLGLSLSYDIVTKGHGGMLEVESVAGEGATFVVILPMDATVAESRIPA